ncbi:actin-related protein 2/3 complex subunit 3-like [Corticium candelabrum]|uniref:actin-related protein 2/3 complex subunit 3-like n=1 Tax=Corticium candelabrum TaxID=121492 RepID=UPI002E261242|nr:actin-related protein 2/3 complex subunit 3-like [Corticium candelabrum]
MPAYHSSFNGQQYRLLANMALLPINTTFKGPAPRGDGSMDIVEEALYYFKANVFFKNYEIKGEADRVLMYLTLYTTECLKKMTKCRTKNDALKEMNTLALANFPIPGDPNFPLNSFFTKAKDRAEGDQMAQYLLQLRQELGARLVPKVFEGDKPSKWWLCFSKKKFMDKTLAAK